MAFIKHLKCTACQAIYPADELMNLCPEDGRPVEVIMDTDAIKQQYPTHQWYQPDHKSMWRFGGLLPLDNQNRDDAQSILSLGEGCTPEISLQNSALAKRFNIDLWLKDEGQPHPGYGANPTGSFKDRGMSMAASMANSFGVKKLVVPTQGNAGDSLTEYALKGGMEVVVIMPDDTPMPIMGRVSALANMHASVSIELVKGTIKEAGALMKQKYLPQGYFNMATFQEPGWRIDGKKTLGLELAEPKASNKNRWSLPDVVIYPTGGGTGVLGMWKAFDELEALGVIDDHRPKVICVQSSKTSPVVNAFNNGDNDTVAVEAGATIATGLNVPGGVGHFKVLDIIRKSGGVALAVEEALIGEQLKSVYQQFGLWIAPEGAATLAAIEQAVDRDLIKPNDRVVAFNTGSFEKYLPNVRSLIFS
jgi:threonine synthase